MFERVVLFVMHDAAIQSDAALGEHLSGCLCCYLAPGRNRSTCELASTCEVRNRTSDSLPVEQELCQFPKTPETCLFPCQAVPGQCAWLCRDEPEQGHQAQASTARSTCKITSCKLEPSCPLNLIHLSRRFAQQRNKDQSRALYR